MAQEKGACGAEKMVVAKSQSKAEEDCCATDAKKAPAKPAAQAAKASKEDCEGMAGCEEMGAKAMAKPKKELAKFKVYVAYDGYKFFGCEESAKKGRESLVADGYIVGQIQKVRRKILI